MKTLPILFQGPMVRSLRLGIKTNTRRIVKMHPDCHADPDLRRTPDGMDLYYPEMLDEGVIGVTCPYGKPGDRLWVRETWMPCDTKGDTHVQILYKATNDVRPDGVSVTNFGAANWFKRPSDEVEGFRHNIEQMEVEGDKWRPSIFLPRWASRVLLEVESVRIERLHAITEADALAEGVQRKESERWPGKTVYLDYDYDPLSDDAEWFQTALQSFRSLWRHINGPDAWEENPWVWRVQFRDVSNAPGVPPQVGTNA